MANFHVFRELKRRNVLRAAVLYAGAVWALSQGIAQLGPSFGAPDWVVRWFVIACVIGFPFFMAFAWFFEFTPSGLKRESEIDPADSIAHSTGRKLDFWIIGVLVVAVALLASGYFVHRNAPAPTAAAQSIPVKSIAVLPFENLSADKDNAYFADGVQDEILTGLSKIGELKVISRTSTQRYQSAPGNLRDIASQLGVANILEGSVQKVGDRVRINVQLIDARNDNHIWAQTYDRKLDDVFAVESEVAQKIASSLQAAITKDERSALNTKPTDNPEAHAAYLKGLALLGHSDFDRDTVQQTISAFQEAVTLDPNFALAWAQLAQQHVWMYWEGFDPTRTRLATAKAALDRAVALAPDVPQVELARAWFLYYGRGDFAAALVAFRKAQLGLPNDAQALSGTGLVERRLGAFTAAVAAFERARKLSPNDVGLAISLAQTLLAQRHFVQASEVIDAGLRLDADDPTLLHLKLSVLWSMGDLDAADRALASMHSGAPGILADRGRQALYRRNYASASDLFQRAAAGAGDFMTPASFGGYIPAAIDWQLQRALSEQGRGSSAIAATIYRQVQAQTQAALAVEPDNVHVEVAVRLALGLACAGLDQREQAVVEGRRGASLVPTSADAWEGSRWQQYLTRIYALNGDAAHALPLIEHLLKTPGANPLTVAMLRIDPTWDPIRHNPGFQALLKQYAEDKPAVSYPATSHSS